MTDDYLDPIIHAPARFRILVTLAVLDDCDTLSLVRLPSMFDLTAGNLITHLRKLEEVGYVHTVKVANGHTSMTSVALTRRVRGVLEPTRRRCVIFSPGSHDTASREH